MNEPPDVEVYRKPIRQAAAQEPLRKSVSAMSTFARSACFTAGQFFSQRTSVFQEYRCFGLWKSLLAT